MQKNFLQGTFYSNCQKSKNSQGIQEKNNETHKGKTIRLPSNFSTEGLQAKRKYKIFKILRKKNPAKNNIFKKFIL